MNEKDSLRGQICEIENIIKQIRVEIDSTNVDTKRINILSEKEDELLNRKVNEEKRVVKIVTEDVKDQIRSLEEQCNLNQIIQNKQENIEKTLKINFEKAQKELEKMLQDTLKRREEQLKELDKLRSDVLNKQNENQMIASKNRELSFEVQRLESYSDQLKMNI